MLCADAVSSAPCPCSALVLFGDDDAGSRLEKEGGDVRERDWGGGRRGDDEATGKAGVRRGAGWARRVLACGAAERLSWILLITRCGTPPGDTFLKVVHRIIVVGWTSPHYVQTLRPVLTIIIYKL